MIPHEPQADLAGWEAVLERFRAQCGGARPPTFEDIAELVRSFPAGEQADMLVNLVCEHLQRTWEHDRGHLVEEYVQYFGRQFADFSSLQSVPAEVVECEFFARHTGSTAADHPRVVEYVRRFAGRTDVADRLGRRCLSGGRYVLVRRRGQGGLGRIWLAYDCHLRRQVAIKEPNPAVADDTRILTRLAREARLTAGLDHPNIVSVHELHDRNGSLPFYVMRLVEGRTLRDGIRDYHGQNGSAGRPRRRLVWNQLLQAYIGVCEAVAYAHQQKVLHRDLKPDNVILGSFGETVLLDWGLAKRLADSGPEESSPVKPRDAAHVASTGDTPAITQTLESLAIVGTPGYMPPEQASGVTDRLSDIFGLGAILYEILTGRQPYLTGADEDATQLLSRIRAADFPRPRHVASKIPRPLEAVCLKAMAARPDDRYTTATAIAEDVRHWLADEPVSVYPNRLHHRLARAFRRHAGTSIVGGMLTILLLIATSVAVFGEVRRQKRQAAMATLSREIFTTHRAGWSDGRLKGWSERTWEQVGYAAELERNPELRDAAFATLSGMDATLFRRLECAATQVVFDAEGKRLLFGRYADSPARVWDETQTRWQVSARCRPGPVVFAADGSPWQIIAETSTRYVVWDIAKNQAIRTLTIPLPDKNLPEPDEIELAMAASPGGALFAAAPVRADGTGTVTIWNVRDGQVLRTFRMKASALEFSPDARWLAAGDEQGQVVVWSIATGEEKARLVYDEVTVHSLAFGRDPRVPGDDKLEHWLLAAGDAGGTVTIWDLGRKLPRSFCRGSAMQIYDVEFNPDGVTLASCGRILVKLWDVVSGRLLLDVEAGNTQYGLAFSPDGKKLAFTSAPVHGSPARADIYDLDFGRGVQTFRGLNASIGKVRFSRDGGQLAALSNNWKVGIWDRATGQLKLVLKVPEGFFYDNADMDISLDGRQLAFSAGSRATLWNLTTGQLMRTWDLPPGLQDQIRFCPDGKLLLIRFETKDGTLPPTSGAPRDKHPRVCRVRNLLAVEPTRPLADEVTEFNWHVYWITATGDGSAFAVTGVHRGPDGERQSVRVFDSLTDNQRWGIPVPKDNIWPPSDPSGELLLVNCVAGSGDLVEFRTGELLRRMPEIGHLSPQAR